MKLIDCRYMEHAQVATWLARLCYPVGVAIERKQPASAKRLMEAVFSARHALEDLTGPCPPKRADGKLARALLAVKCARAILRNIPRDGLKEPARVTAALEVAERLIGMIGEPESTWPA
jgi:hypothetical protein